MIELALSFTAYLFWVFVVIMAAAGIYWIGGYLYAMYKYMTGS